MVMAAHVVAAGSSLNLHNILILMNSFPPVLFCTDFIIIMKSVLGKDEFGLV